jgi:PleD family two-component response regulator
VAAHADGVVVGSALVNVIRDGLGFARRDRPAPSGGGLGPGAGTATKMTRVLVIDDDRLQFRLLQAHFRNFQAGTYELDWSETYEDGLARLLTGATRCLLDFRLGERDGLQLIREAAAKDCRTPIVFLTAESSENVDIQAMEAGALDYLVKGEINPRSLERSLRYALKLGETLEALRRLATRDELTGLLNRREYDRILVEEEDRARRFGQPLALVVIDIDLFKSINDTHGHPAGDAVLREAARGSRLHPHGRPGRADRGRGVRAHPRADRRRLGPRGRRRAIAVGGEESR